MQSGARAVHFGTQIHTSTIVKIGCEDPLFVRADTLVLNRGDDELFAIVDGIMSSLGAVSPDISARLQRNPRALIEAFHFAGGTVRREVPVALH